MPSTRKRIGYLPSINIQEIIINIANKEKLSQSKVVGILVEEALIARGLWDRQNSNNLTEKRSHTNEPKMNNLYSKYNELDEFISDKGIIYNTKRFKIKSENSSLINEEDY
jgi:hypothetical protein